MSNLRAVDLNLLVVLEALLIEGRVSRASVRLGMSQPAVSHALNRLRHLLDDPLFVRGPRGLAPTGRALAVQAPLREALDRVRAMVDEPLFDPSEARQTFRLAMSDYGAALVLPALLARIRAEAPGIDLIVTQHTREDAIRLVLDGALDLALGVFPELPPGFRSSLLVDERFACVADRANPALRKGTLTLDAYLRAPHLLVSVHGEPEGEVEAALAHLGFRRRVAAILPHFMVAPSLVLGTDLLLTLASRGLREHGHDPRLVTVDPPFAIPAFPFVQVWHARNDASDAQAWLRRQVEQAVDR